MSFGSFLKKYSGYDALKRIAGSPKRQRERQYAREDTSIQRRVADARAAGVHPLFALGASLPGGSAVQSTGSAAGDAIQSLTRAIPRKGKATGLSLVDHAAIAESEARTRSSDASTAVNVFKLSQLKRDSINQNGPNHGDVSILEPEPVRKGPSESDFVGPPRPRLTILDDGTMIRQDPKISTGQELEDTHGEIMGNVYSARNEATRMSRQLDNYIRRNLQKWYRTQWPVRFRKFKKFYPEITGDSP